MKTSEFDYHLPPELIAQEPIEPRDAARMLVLHRDTGEIEHRHFRDLDAYLHPGDVMVLNRTRVIPARVWARKLPTGGRVELLLLRSPEPGLWEALVRGRRVRPGTQLQITDRQGEREGPLASVIAETEAGGRTLRFPTGSQDWLQELGEVPLPPYIHQRLEDAERYQTVYAAVPGSAAAPTAGLHFTPDTICRLHSLGVTTEQVTLHIGLDTFRPVQEERIEEHVIHTEYCEVSPEVTERLSEALASGRRLVAVGTTAVRTLETSAREAEREGASSRLAPYGGDTDLYITPGYRFRAVGTLLTNFHLPRSTLLMLVSAFAGKDLVLAAYREAVDRRYRFFSFGDCMLIL